VVKGINSMKRQAAEDPAPAAPSREEVLLAEIRDAIRAAPAAVSARPRAAVKPPASGRAPAK
jgi:large conductance mechanosensitive channel